jgi:hypothetical protein
MTAPLKFARGGRGWRDGHALGNYIARGNYKLSEPGMNLVALHPIQGHSMLAWDTKPKMLWSSMREFGSNFFSSLLKNRRLLEQVSSIQRREELEKALKFIRKGDTLVVTKLDRLARSIPDLVRIIGTLQEKQATLRILDTNSPTGRLLLNLVGSVAQFEREIMLERQKRELPRQRLRELQRTEADCEGEGRGCDRQVQSRSPAQRHSESCRDWTSVSLPHPQWRGTSLSS